MKKNRTPLIVLIFVVVLAICAAMVVVYKMKANSRDAENESRAEAYNTGGMEALEDDEDEDDADAEDSAEADMTDEDEEAEADDSSFYEKLAAGKDVSILILGDEIGASESVSDSDSWASQLVEYLEETYMESSGGEISVTNLSAEGADSADGYDTVVDHDGSYDLVILCFGKYETDDDVALNYEILLRAVIQKYHCSVLSILESAHINEMLDLYDHYSTSTYTEKMDTIISLCDHYGVQLADTVYTFYKSSSTYNSMANDGIPNEEGYALYYETIRDLIDENVENETGTIELADPVDDDATEYDLETE